MVNLIERNVVAEVVIQNEREGRELHALNSG